MISSSRQSDPPDLGVTMAGVRFRSPIGLGPIGGGSHFGKPEADKDREDEASLRFFLEHVRAGSSCLYLNFSYLTEATLGKLLEGTAPADPPRCTAAWGERFLRAHTPVAPYGLEGLYSTVSPGPSTPRIEAVEATLVSQRKLIEALKEQGPADVPIIGGVVGCGGLPDAYVDAARKCEELGLDLGSYVNCAAPCRPACEVGWITL